MSVLFHELEVSSVTRETADCSSFEFAVPDHLRDAFRYKAGQHLMFEVVAGEEKVTRCYSLSSCPALDEPLQIAVKRVAGGRVSNWLNDHLTVGSSVLVSAPSGRFVLDPKAQPQAPLFFFAGGSGITPIIALLKSALITTKRSITLVYANRDQDAVIYGEALRRLAAEHSGRLTIHHHCDADQGHLDVAAVSAFIEPNEVAEFFLCGPGPFMEVIEGALEKAGVHESLVHLERFTSPALPAAAHAVDMTSLAAPGAFSIWLNGRSRTVPYVKGKTLLQCADEAGLTPPRSCESGYCGSCMAHVKSGDVYMRTHEALSDRDVDRGMALLCQSVPSSAEPLEVDADLVSFRATSEVRPPRSKRAAQLAAALAFSFMIAGTLVLRLVH